MTAKPRPLALPALLDLDALTCGIMGIGLIVAANPIHGWTGLPAPLLFWAGVLLLPITAFMAVSARMVPVPRWAATIIVAGNCAWVLASLLLPVTGLVSPNILGWLLLGGQAAFVAVLTMAEFNAGSRSTAFAQGAS